MGEKNPIYTSVAPGASSPARVGANRRRTLIAADGMGTRLDEKKVLRLSSRLRPWPLPFARIACGNGRSSQKRQKGADLGIGPEAIPG